MMPEHEKPATPFYSALGRAFARWQDVEGGMYLITHAILGTKPRTTSIIFFLIRSPDTKIDLVDKLCRENLPHESLLAWSEIHKRLLSASTTRNKFAHFEASSVADPAQFDDADPPLVLTAPFMDYLRWDKKSGTFFHTREIMEIGTAWGELARDLICFVAANFEPASLHPELLPPAIMQILDYAQRELLQRRPPPEEHAQEI